MYSVLPTSGKEDVGPTQDRDVEAVIFQTLPLPHLALPLPPTKNKKTTVDNFFLTFVAL